MKKLRGFSYVFDYMPMKLLPLPLLVLLFAQLQATGSDAPQSFTSGTSRAALVELYTSQGCSSCPPAEAFLSKLMSEPELWKRWVPVAFHVDYWDYLGWQDVFATAANTEMQRQHAERNSGRVYTPAFFINGEEWRGFFQGQELPVASRDQTGILRVETGADQAVKVTYRDAEAGKRYVAHVALLGFGIDVPIQAGENRGRTLEHDFTALDVSAVAMKGKDGSYHSTLKVSVPETITAERYGLAVWVTEAGELEPLQTTGGVLDPEWTAKAGAS
ncbi:MAG: DUF1223 domain-containing protein [Verrucomicrobiota bacterium]